MSVFYKITKHFQGGNGIYYAEMPSGKTMPKVHWGNQLEKWGEDTMGGRGYGYRIKAEKVKTVEKGARWLPFCPDYLVDKKRGKTGAIKAKGSPSRRTRGQSRVSNADIAATNQPAISGSGMKSRKDATSSLTSVGTDSDAPSMSKSLTAHPNSGCQLPLLDADVVLLETTGDGGLPTSRETVVALTAMLTALMANTTSGDIMVLSSGYARRLAVDAGVSSAEFDRVMDAVRLKWRRIASGSWGYIGRLEQEISDGTPKM